MTHCETVRVSIVHDLEESIWPFRLTIYGDSCGTELASEQVSGCHEVTLGAILPAGTYVIFPGLMAPSGYGGVQDEGHYRLKLECNSVPSAVAATVIMTSSLHGH